METAYYENNRIIFPVENNMYIFFTFIYFVVYSLYNRELIKAVRAEERRFGIIGCTGAPSGAQIAPRADCVRLCWDCCSRIMHVVDPQSPLTTQSLSIDCLAGGGAVLGSFPAY